MAVVNNISRNAAAGAFFPAMVTVGTSGDTLNYSQGSAQELALFNTSASPVVVTIDGAGGTTIAVAGAGDTPLSVAAGYAITVPATSFAFVMLDKIPAYCAGVVAISAATAAVVKAVILQ